MSMVKWITLFMATDTWIQRDTCTIKLKKILPNRLMDLDKKKIYHKYSRNIEIWDLFFVFELKSRGVYFNSIVSCRYWDRHRGNTSF